MAALSAGVDNDFPDQVVATLQRNNSSKQVCAALNTAATLLAVGCSDGGVALYDFETRGVAKLLKGHTAAVVALSWNETSHHLITASLDGLIIRWNVLEGTQGAYATMGTVSTAAASAAADDEGHSKRRIKSVHLHPTITDLAILNFADHDAPMILQLQPTTDSSAPSAASAASNAAAAASASPTPVESSPNSAFEPVPRLPLWSRFISTPFVAVAASEAQPETPATPVVDLTATPAAGTAMSDEAGLPAAASAADSATPATPSTPSAPAAASSLLSTLAENAPHYTKWHATVAIWDHSGAFIFEGNTKGTVFVYQLQIDRAQLESYRRKLPAPGQSALPSWLHLRLVFVEARPVFRDRASRSVQCSIQALVLSNCSSYLLCNFSTQLKVFRVDSALLTKPGVERDAALERMAEHCATDLESREIALNGARYVPSEWRSKKSKQTKGQQAQARGDSPSGGAAGSHMNKSQKKKAQRARSQAARVAASADSNSNEGGATPAADDEEKDGGNGGGGAGGVDSKSAQNSDNDDDDAAGGSSSSPAAGSRPSQPFLEFLRSFTDPVARVPWRRCAFNHSSDFLVAGSQERGEHRIHIWSTHTGQLTKILLGPTEGLLDLVAHPYRSVLITTCTSGSIYIWQRKYVENWSAFAPDFEELEDNTEYIEKESEFDLVTKTHDPAQEADRRAQIQIDVCREDDEDTTAMHDSHTRGDADSTLSLPPRGSSAWMRTQLISLPTIIQPDAETSLAYQKRRSIALEIAEKKKQEEIAATQAAASAAPAAMDTEAPAAATPAKRTLEEEAADEANKRARI